MNSMSQLIKLFIKRCVLILCLFMTMTGYAETVAIGNASGRPTDDVALTETLQSLIQGNPNLKVTITTHNGIVNLSGTISTASEAIQLVQTITSTPQVVDVNTSQLKVTENNPALVDLLITARVQGALVRQEIFGKGVDIKHLPIKVQTNQQIVYLYGTVDTQNQMLTIVRLVQSMKSIPRVISLLQVRTGTVYIN